MPKYEITGKGKDTGRKRKRRYTARDEIAARKLADEDGTLVETVTEIPPAPPTDQQLDYAKELGIPIPENVTGEALSDLISIAVNRDKPATERHKSFGKLYGLEFTDHIGKKALFNKIQAALITPGREKELLSWFTFRVYRELVSGVAQAPISEPDDPIIQEIAEELANDEKVVKSVRRYEGRELIWFGEWTAPDGYVLSGGSNRTTAYKQASMLLKQRATFPDKPQNNSRLAAQKRSHNTDIRGAKAEPQGCLAVVMFALVIPALAFSIALARDFFA